jgi:hypothetical protein
LATVPVVIADNSERRKFGRVDLVASGVGVMMLHIEI